MGLNQSTHGTWHTNAICNLHLATGKICRPGSGPFSLTGQPNAMGGREVGYLSHTLPGQRAVTSAQDRAFVENIWGVPAGTIRPEPGLDAVSLFRKLETGEVKAVWINRHQSRCLHCRNRQRVINGLQKARNSSLCRMPIIPRKRRSMRTFCCRAHYVGRSRRHDGDIRNAWLR